jgi:hypothetical protein
MLQTPVTLNPKSSFTDLSMWEIFLAGMLTVYILNFPSNLLMLNDVDCWNSQEATPIGLSFSAVLPSCLFMALLKAVALYLLYLNVFLECQILVFRHS